LLKTKENHKIGFVKKISQKNKGVRDNKSNGGRNEGDKKLGGKNEGGGFDPNKQKQTRPLSFPQGPRK